MKEKGQHEEPSQTRDPFFDNIKGFAIIFVVTGHLISYTGVNENSHAMQTIFTFIYMFHMPLFIWVSGLFAGDAWRKRHVAPADKFALYLGLYLIFILLAALLDLVATGKCAINPFLSKGAPWFMLVLSLFMLMVPIIGKMRPKIFLVASIIVAALSGAFLDSPHELALSRLSSSPFWYQQSAKLGTASQQAWYREQGKLVPPSIEPRIPYRVPNPGHRDGKGLDAYV